MIRNSFLFCASMLFAVTAMAAAPADENYDDNTSSTVAISTGSTYTLDGIVYSTHRSDGTLEPVNWFLANSILPNTTLDDGDNAFAPNLDIALSNIAEIRIGSENGDEFRLISLVMDATPVTNDSETTITITGYKDGSAVGGATDTVDFTTSDASGTITYVKGSGNSGSLTFDSNWNNIDQIRLVGSGSIGIIIPLFDDFDFDAAVGASTPGTFTFDTTSSVPSTTLTSTISGVTLTATSSGGGDFDLQNISPYGNVLFAPNQNIETTWTLSFSAPINISQMFFAEGANRTIGNYRITPNTGTAVVVPAASGSVLETVSTPGFLGVTSIVFSYTDSGFSLPANGESWQLAVDSIVFTVAATAPEIAVSGNSTAIADGDGSPAEADHTDFGSTAVAGGTVSRTFTITNSGSGALTLSGTPKVVVSGTHSADFTVTSQPTSPVASGGGTTTFTVQFDPSDSGSRTATLSIANDDSDENPFNFSIKGTGTAAASDIFDFETATASGGSSVTQTVAGITLTITDNGTEDNWLVLDANDLRGSVDNLCYLNSETASTVTFTFDAEVDLQNLLYQDVTGPDFETSSANYVFTPTGGSGSNSAVTIPYTSLSTDSSVGRFGTINLNWSNVSSFTMTVTADAGDLVLPQPAFDTIVFTAAATPSNTAPTDIALSASSVNHSDGTNATVGTLSTTDADSGDSHTYTLVAGSGDTNNASFNINGTSLRANDPSELPNTTYSVRIQTNDGNSGTYAEAFTITVTPATAATSTGANFDTTSGGNLSPALIFGSADESLTIGNTSHIAGSTANGGAGTDILSIPTGSDLTGLSSLTNFESLTLASDASVTMSVAQHDAFSGTITAAGTEQITFSATGGDTTTTGFPAIETYVLGTGGISFTLGTAGQSVTGSSGADTINIGSLNATGTLNGGDGTDTLQVGNVGNVSTATVSNFENLTVASGATILMAANQSSQFTGTITAAGSETVIVSGDGAFTTLANIEAFTVLDDSTNARTVTVSSAGTSVTATHASDAVLFQVGGITYTGTLTGNTDEADTLSLANGANISGGTITGISNLDVVSGASVTMTEAQHDAFASIAGTGTNLIALSAADDDGIVTGDSDIEYYTLGAALDFTLGAAAQNVSGSSGDDTVNIGSLNATGTLNGGDGTDTLQVGNVGNVSTATVSNFENLTVASGGTILASAHQLSQFAGTITAAGSETVIVSGDGAFTTLPNIETFTVLDDSTNARTITLGAANTSVSATNATDAVTFNLGALTYTGTLTGEGTVNDTVQLSTGANIAGGTLTAIENLTLASNASVTLNPTQLASFSTINASGTETVTITGDGNFSTVANIESFIAGDSTTDSRTITLAQATAEVDATAETDAITFSIASALTFTGTLTGEATTADTLELAADANISGATIAGISNLTLATSGGATMTPAQLTAFTGTITAPGSNTVTFSAAGTLSGTNLDAIETFVIGVGGSKTITLPATNASGKTLVVISTLDGDHYEVTGSDGDQTIAGSNAADIIDGGAGNDTLSGANGADTLTGGAGTDRFTGSFSQLNGDTITDLSAGETILLTGVTGLSTANVRFNGAKLEIDTDATTFAAVEVTITTSTDLSTTLGISTVVDLGSDTLITIQPLPPTVTAVTASTANGTYKAGDLINITVQFSGDVTVTGTPTLTLETGITDRAVNYASGSNTDTLTFTYTVQAGDTSSDLDYHSTSALTAGTSIKDAFNQDAVRTLPAPGASNSLGANKAIVIDTTAPTVTSVAVPSDDTYVADDNLDFTVNFVENVTVTGTPQLALTIGSTTRQATYQSGSDSTALVFHYTVQTGDLDADGIAVGSLSANSGTLRDTAGNDATLTLNAVGSTAAVLVDAVAPTVSSVDVPTSASYRAGQSLDFTVNFTENVNIATANPTLAITVGATSRTADYVSGSGTNALLFRYTVQAGETDTDGIAVGALATTGTLRDGAGNDATLTLNSVGSTAAVLVDTTAPTISIGAPSATLTSTTNVTYTVTYVDAAFNASTLAAGNVTVNKTGTADATTAVTGTGTTRTVTLSGITGDGTLGISIAAGTATDTAGNTAPSAGPSTTFTVDNTAPNAPAVTAITEDTGASAADGVTSDTGLIISGTAEANASVEVFVDEASIGTANADGSGAWSYDHSGTALTEATYSITAKSTDSAGNTSAASTGIDVTIDTTAPAAPAITGISDDTGDNTTDQITSDTTLILSGTADAGTTVTLTRLSAGEIGTATANEDGAWSYDYTATELGAGEHSFTATATDTAGNASNASDALIVTVDTATPDAPVITAISADSGTATDQITNDNTLTVSGTAEAGATVTVTRNGAGNLGTTTADGTTGAWTYDYTATELPDGDYIFGATATDTAGNTSIAAADFPVTIDTTAPTAPVVTGVSDDTGNSASDAITSDQTLSISGTAEGNATINVLIGGTSIGTTTADGTGAWTFDHTAATLAAGSYTITATATDTAANTSDTSADLALIVRLAPTISDVAVSGKFGEPFVFVVEAHNPPLTFSATDLPDGLSISGATISGTPTATGTFNATITVNNVAASSSATYTITINKAEQTISFTNPGSKVFGDAAFDLGATASSGLAVTYSVVSGPATVTGSTLTITGAGEVTVRASQAGNDNYLAATDVDQTFTIEKAVATVTLGNLAATYDSGSHQASVTTVPASLQVDVTYAGSATLPVAAGTYAVVATINEPNYQGSATGSLVIAQAAQTIAFANPGAMTFLDEPFAVAPTASSGLGVVVSVVSGPATVSANTVTITGAGEITLRAAQAGNANYLAAADVDQTFNVAKAAATVVLSDLEQTYTGAALAPTITTDPTGLTVELTYDSAATAPTAAGSYVVVATIVDANYQGADDDTFIITKANQTVTIGAVGTLTAGIATELSATASSGLTPVTFAVTSGAATFSGSTLTALSTAPITITAAQAGDANYNAGSTSLTITSIQKQSQTITFAALANQQANSDPFDLSATASSGLNVTFTVVSGPVMLSGNTVTMTGASGTVTVRADQAGDAIFAAATPVTRTFEVIQAGPLIYFGTTNEDVEFAAQIPEGSTTGTLFGFITQSQQYYILTFQVNEDRTITALDLQILGDPVIAATSLAQRPLRRIVREAAAERTTARDLAYTFTGTIQNGLLNLNIAELGVTLTGAVEPPDGPTKPIAGLYESTSLNSANGTTSSIVGTSGKVYVLAVTPRVITGGSGTVGANGTFDLTTNQTVRIIGNVDAPSTTVTGTIILPDGEEDPFAGLSTDTLRTDRLINLSTRAHVDATTDSGALVAGFVIGGDSPKRVLLRAVGPGLVQFGLTTALPDPQVTIYNSAGEVIAEVDNWGGDAETTATMSNIGAFPLAADSLDAVYTTELAPGAYTMRVTNNGAGGVAIAEIYDAAENPNSEYQRLINISSRGRVIGGEGVLVGGFIVTGNSPKRVLVRGAGPGLAAYHVPGVLSDPTLKVYNSQEQVIAANDNWETPTPIIVGQRTATAAEITAANAQLGAFAFAAGATDAALIITLSPGAYTVELDAATAGESGNALIEIYEIPE
ncbi:Ig-like domain-containing protein [Synoicihabitans lomoniglobus]|uniref:Ig-like domain-containing protein n=1 Tax=Synoicihabitans lomoniglobus TaxID=2909285 RepID=A0AAF0I3B8_9BACT|nr:Ig-like domain-containing protein [Opitutaceae bacterium LMO-M01]